MHKVHFNVCVATVHLKLFAGIMVLYTFCTILYNRAQILYTLSFPGIRNSNLGLEVRSPTIFEFQNKNGAPFFGIRLPTACVRKKHTQIGGEMVSGAYSPCCEPYHCSIVLITNRALCVTAPPLDDITTTS